MRAPPGRPSSTHPRTHTLDPCPVWTVHADPNTIPCPTTVLDRAWSKIKEFTLQQEQGGDWAAGPNDVTKESLLEACVRQPAIKSFIGHAIEREPPKADEHGRHGYSHFHSRLAELEAEVVNEVRASGFRGDEAVEEKPRRPGTSSSGLAQSASERLLATPASRPFSVHGQRTGPQPLTKLQRASASVMEDMKMLRSATFGILQSESVRAVIAARQNASSRGAPPRDTPKERRVRSTHRFVNPRGMGSSASLPQLHPTRPATTGKLGGSLAALMNN